MIVSFIVLCCVCVNGVRGSETDPPSSIAVVHFDVQVRDNRAVCVPSKKEIVLPENSTVRLDATLQQKLERVKCHYRYPNDVREFGLGNEYKRNPENVEWFQDYTITKQRYGIWSCKLKFNKNQATEISPVDQEPDDDGSRIAKYNYVICDITVKNPDVTFDVLVRDNKAVCTPSQKELTLAENNTVRLDATLPKQYKHFETITCHYGNDSKPIELGDKYYGQDSNYILPWVLRQQIRRHMYGTWTCNLTFNIYLKYGEVEPYVPGEKSFSYVICSITMRDPDEQTTGTSTTIAATSSTTAATLTTDGNTSSGVDNKTWYIIGGVGIIVLFIIIGQTIALCYFRRKAQPRRTMDNMRPRSRFGFDRGDRARYSAPPCKKSKASNNRAQADTDSHIYEMVGINALYNKSSDLNPEASSEKNIKDRPPLPLPHEIPKPVIAETPARKPAPMTSMPSTLSLSSTSSSSTLINKKRGKQLPPPPEKGGKKAPARPPKQIDEESIPGPLLRPAIPTPAPAAASVSAPKKTLPKAPSTESPMSELKNIFRKRNAGKDTQSPAVTSEKKDPPKVQAKIKNNPPKPAPSQKPPSLTKPTVNQQNQIKLIMPKIEAAIKAPKPMLLKSIEPTTSPIKSLPVTPAKVVPNVKQKPVPEKPVSQKSLPQKPVTEKPVTQPTPPKPVPKSLQNRPLPKPETSRDLPPEPVYPDPPPSPPIYEMTGEDFTPEDDDEEWTYEQLGQYNIYNI